jgi:hypothetical protein
LRRREFVYRICITMGGAAVGMGVAGCAPMCPRTIKIGTNHGHTMDLPDRHVRRGVETVYDITGEGVHPHLVTLTADHFAILQKGGTVECISTADGKHGEIIGSAHVHSVTIVATCPAG